MTARDLAAPTSSSLLAGRYRTLFVLGRGGMGTVEAALEKGDKGDGAYERVVALKRLLPDSARDRRHVEMFLREAKLAAMLEHPNVVRAFDYGEASGELYLAMEYVEGQPLSVVLKSLSEPLAPAVAAHVLAAICDGLHAAHELKDAEGKALAVVHRDVSPQNVMLGYDGRVRLLDFGVAKIEAESVTKTGEVKGKTAYMSPEQAMGDAIDRRSDLFGVGAVLFECLTLKRMWGDGTDMEVIRKLALEEPPDLPESAPPAMRALYRRLVARDAKDRPATAAEVADALRAIGRDAGAGDRDTEQIALAALLGERFGGQAEELRKKLETSLDEVAPERAHELRESVVPGSVPRPAETPPEPARAAPGAAPATEPRSKWIVIGVAAVAAVGFLAWRASNVPPPPTATASASATAPASAPASASASASAPATAPAPAPASATASATASASASASASATASASASAPAPAPLPLPPRPPSSLKPRPSASAAPAASHTKPPLDIDDHPF